jgi:hypothetical protein
MENCSSSSGFLDCVLIAHHRFLEQQETRPFARQGPGLYVRDSDFRKKAKIKREGLF